MAKGRRLRTRKKRTKQNRGQASRIDVLPDDVLLGVFDLYVDKNPSSWSKWHTEEWQTLVHVCRRWRSLVFGSPRRLGLRLHCTQQTLAKGTLDVWPALPFIIYHDNMDNMDSTSGMDSVIAALGQSNRVCQVNLTIAGSQLENVLAAMQVPFPELTELQLTSYDKSLSAINIPDPFLGGRGFSPSLRFIGLSGIPFLGLPELLSSAVHLVELWLPNIPHSGYISPESIVALLSALSSLEKLSLGFESPQSRPDSRSRSLPLLKRSILPALKKVDFKGVTEYLEDLVTRIDTPQLNVLSINFFNQIDFYTPRLVQFINRTSTPRALDEVHVQFDDRTARVNLRSRTSQFGLNDFEIAVSCEEPDWQLSSMEQVCNFSLPPLPAVEDLYIKDNHLELVWKDDAIENTLWLDFLLPFTAVKDLYISKSFAPGIAAALQERAGGRTEVTPSLENIFVEGLEESGPFQENIGHFVAARQLSGQTIAISEWGLKSLRAYVDDLDAMEDSLSTFLQKKALAEYVDQDEMESATTGSL